ncbi:uncharacterized protein [Aegilops tauschii subsp. strangulata]|uniref:uncharacterized protein isoform X2 n=1 Tax=Aegilops tauschii subsp. strangulata TaxID=200361 RepID=UPI001ABCBB49
MAEAALPSQLMFHWNPGRRQGHAQPWSLLTLRSCVSPCLFMAGQHGVVAASLLHLLGRGMPIDVPGNLPVGYWLLAKLHHLPTQAGVPEAALPTLLFSRRLCTQAQPPVREAASLALLVFSRHVTTQLVPW